MNATVLDSDLTMPRLSDSMSEGTIVAWLKKAGDSVEVGEEIVEIETDKANMIHESDRAGILAEIIAEAGETVPVGAVIARLDGNQAQSAHRSTSPKGAPAPPAGSLATARSEAAAQPAAPGKTRWEGSGGADGSARVNASPLARRIAASLGIDLRSLQGTGPRGRVVKLDVENAIRDTDHASTVGLNDAQPIAPIAREQRRITEIKQTRIQALTARRMQESKATIPHFYLQYDHDVTLLMESRRRLIERRSDDQVVPTVNDIILKACAVALKEHPHFNSTYAEGRLEVHPEINIGFAVGKGKELLVPTVRQADSRGLFDIAAETKKLAERVAQGKVTPSDLSAGTFTVSNLGMFGVIDFQPIINPPQVAILGVGAVRRVDMSQNGETRMASVMRTSLACDHRALNGVEAALFLKSLQVAIESPLALSS